MSTKPTPIRVAVTGASGLLGRALIQCLVRHGHHVTAGTHRTPIAESAEVTAAALDLLDPASVREWIAETEPQTVIHAAAWTDVDACERDPDRAQTLNVTATRNLVETVGAICPDARVIYLSTDYVFDGRKGPYDEDAIPSPANVYGRTKADGERLVLGAGSGNISVRSASFLGVGNAGRPTFAESMVYTMRDRPPLLVAMDQCSNLTPVGFLADAVTEIVECGHSGIWHVAGSEVISRYDLAIAMARVFELPSQSARGIPYAGLKRAAARPLNGGLISKRTLGAKCPPLVEALEAWKADLIAAGRWHEA